MPLRLVSVAGEGGEGLGARVTDLVFGPGLAWDCGEGDGVSSIVCSSGWIAIGSAEASASPDSGRVARLLCGFGDRAIWASAASSSSTAGTGRSLWPNSGLLVRVQKIYPLNSNCLHLIQIHSIQ